MSKPIEIVCQQCFGLLRLLEVPKQEKGNCPDCGFEIELRQFVPELFEGIQPLGEGASPKKVEEPLEQKGEPSLKLQDPPPEQSQELKGSRLERKSKFDEPFSSHFIKTADNDSEDFKSLFQNEQASPTPKLEAKKESVQRKDEEEAFHREIQRKSEEFQKLERELQTKQQGIDAAREEIEAVAKELETKEKGLELASADKGRLEEERHKLKLAREMLEQDKESWEKEVRSQTAFAEELNTSKKKLSKQELELKEKQEALTRKENDLQGLEAQIGTKQKGIDAAREEVEAKAKELEEKEKDLELASIDKGKLEEEQNKLKLAREELAEESQLLEKAKQELESQRTGLESRNKEVEKFHERLNTSKEELSKQQLELKEKQEALTRKENDLEVLETKQQGIGAAREGIEAKAKELEEKENTLNDKEGRLRDFEQEIEYKKKGLEESRAQLEVQLKSLTSKENEIDKAKSLKDSSKLSTLKTEDDKIAREQKKLEDLRSKVKEDYNALEAEKKDFEEYRARMRQSLNEQLELIKNKGDLSTANSKKIVEDVNDDSYQVINTGEVNTTASKKSATRRFAPSTLKEKKVKLRRFDEAHARVEENKSDESSAVPPVQVVTGENPEENLDSNGLQKGGSLFESDSMKADSPINAPRNNKKGKFRFFGLIIIPFIICTAFGYLVYENLISESPIESLANITTSAGLVNQVEGSKKSKVLAIDQGGGVAVASDASNVNVILPEISHIDLDLEPAIPTPVKSEEEVLITTTHNKLASKAPQVVLLYDDADLKKDEHVGLLLVSRD